MFRSTLLIFLAAFASCSRQSAEIDNNLTGLFRTELSSASRADDDWAIAKEAREFSFPADHAAHENYRIEWWYYTGNLQSDDGRRFGYQLTFFRTGLHQRPTNPSKWAVRDLYTAHFAVSDISNKRHHCFQKNSRAGIKQAGAEPNSYHVWNGEWSVQQFGTEHRLQAADGDVDIELSLEQTGQPVLHGDKGLSQKGATDGNASYYYSFTRMPTVGRVRIGNKNFTVTGGSWMDHEFSTSFLEPGQLGWDWMSIQLDSGADLMLYRMRRADRSKDPYSSGTYVRDGAVQHITGTEYAMIPRKSWSSSVTGATYPLHWNVSIPSLGYELEISPAFEAQEMTTADTTGISYWEGAIDVRGNAPDGPTNGQGYMELTGYVGQGLGTLFSQ